MQAASPASSRRSFPYARAAVLLIVALTLFRFWYCTRIELVADEAYYWLWSQRLDLSYFSKGPGVAWTIAAGTWLWGDTVFGIRFFSVLLSALTSFLLFLLARKLASEKVAFWAVAIANSIPLFSVGSILMTIDPLSVFFWALACLTFWKAKDQTSLGPWVLTGMVIGAGALCKYTNLAQLICFALFCGFQPAYRHHGRRLTFPAMTLAALAATAPVILWNSRHDWITLQHLLHRGALDETLRISAREHVQFLTGQCAVISPLLFLGSLVAIFWPRKSWSRGVEFQFLLFLFLPLMAFYTLLSWNDSGQPNWTAPAYVAGLILLVSQWQEAMRGKPWLKWMTRAAVALALLETVLLHNTFWLNLPPRLDPHRRVRGSEDLARQVAGLQAETGARFIIANKYSYASLLAFYHPDRAPAFLPHSKTIQNQFSFWPGYRERFLGESAIFVSDSDEIPDQFLREFAQILPARRIQTTHRGRPVSTFYLTVCRTLLLGAEQSAVPASGTAWNQMELAKSDAPELTKDRGRSQGLRAVRREDRPDMRPDFSP